MVIICKYPILANDIGDNTVTINIEGRIRAKQTIPTT